MPQLLPVPDWSAELDVPEERSGGTADRLRPGLPVVAPAEVVGAATAPKVRPAEAAEAPSVPAAGLVPWVAAIFGTELGWDKEPVPP